MKILSILALVLCSAACSLAQDSVFERHPELFTRVAFSNSITTLGGAPTTVYSRTYDFSINPGIGLFFDRSFELIIEPRYTIHYRNSENVSSSYDIYGTTWDHRLGLRVGVQYNFSQLSFLVPLVGVKYGISWSRSFSDGNLGFNDTHWASAESSFPDVILGSRFVITEDFQLLATAEYERIYPYLSRDHADRSNKSIVVSFGFATRL